MRSWTLTIALLALSGCTTIPPQLQGDYPALAPAQVQPAAFGSPVRWGGVILGAVNTRDDTCFEVLSRDLDKYLRPRLEDRTGGRFLACKQGFYDPEVFARGREVTLVGRIRDVEFRNVDEFKYRYPVVDVSDLVLWEVREEVMIVDNYYDPFWHPFYWYGPHWGYYPYYPPVRPAPGRSYVRHKTLLPDPADLPEEQ